MRELMLVPSQMNQSSCVSVKASIRVSIESISSRVCYAPALGLVINPAYGRTFRERDPRA